MSTQGPAIGVTMCPTCDGDGWTYTSPTMATQCKTCNASGVVALTDEDYPRGIEPREILWEMLLAKRGGVIEELSNTVEALKAEVERLKERIAEFIDGENGP